jgi:hypothetical protein
MAEPTILMVTGDPNPTELLLTALSDYLGVPVEIFVRTHAHTGETIVVILPTEGPSLAAALLAWAENWWDADAEERFGSPDTYLLGYGVVVPENDHATYSPSCPYCGEDALFVVSATFSADGIPLDASSFETESVTVACHACQRRFPSERVTL